VAQQFQLTVNFCGAIEYNLIIFLKLSYLASKMASFFNARNIFNIKNRLLLTFSQNTLSSLFVFKPHTCIIITRNIFWQHNALRRIAEKERVKEKMKKVGQNTVEKNKVKKQKFEKSGLKTSKLKETFNKKEISDKKKESEKVLGLLLYLIF
jgi:hypothetical protein